MSLKNVTVTFASIQLIFLLFISHFTPLLALSQPNGSCLLDERWKGKWFQTGYPQPIFIDSHSIGPKGNCLEKAGEDKFLFFHASTNCHKCVVINERHRNILQYKESQYCEDKNSLDILCSQIPGDGPLYSLFRIDAQPIDCPFKGAPFTFTYNRGHGECSNPVSNVDECTESSRLLLRYQACPNVPKSESTTEELECLGGWKEGSNHYLIGKLDNRLVRNSHEERYKCFIYEKIKGDGNVGVEGHTGYRVAQSGDASCTGISSPSDGATAFVFKKVDQSGLTKCRFPNWVMAQHWYSLDGKISVKTHVRNSTMHIDANNVYPLINGAYRAVNDRIHSGSALFSAGSKFMCQRRFDISDRQVTIAAKRKERCKSEEVCLNIYKRDNYVIEIRVRPRSGADDGDCGFKSNDMSTGTESYATLVSASVTQRRCPQLGKYITATATKRSTSNEVQVPCIDEGRGSYKTLVVGCGHRGTMEFYSKCATDEPIVSSYMCHGSWEDSSGTGYFIASPLSRSSNSADRYCFIYKPTEEGLRVSRSSQTCRNDFQGPGFEGFWTFNLTVDGQCAEPLTGRSIHLRAQIFSFCTVLYYSVIIFALFLTKISSLLLTSTFVSDQLTISRTLKR